MLTPEKYVLVRSWIQGHLSIALDPTLIVQFLSAAVQNGDLAYNHPVIDDIDDRHGDGFELSLAEIRQAHVSTFSRLIDSYKPVAA